MYELMEIRIGDTVKLDDFSIEVTYEYKKGKDEETNNAWIGVFKGEHAGEYPRQQKVPIESSDLKWVLGRLQEKGMEAEKAAKLFDEMINLLWKMSLEPVALRPTFVRSVATANEFLPKKIEETIV